ncbi:hypothetical protein JTB14_020576 [Gonioctena quinquepunctata]|nr:hypothetical protein JTB14_020576 [Gonioctena quinquepunctata]
MGYRKITTDEKERRLDRKQKTLKKIQEATNWQGTQKLLKKDQNENTTCERVVREEDEKKRAEEGVGLIIAPNRSEDATKEGNVNHRPLVLEMKLADEDIWTIITAYGNHADAKNEIFLLIRGK